MQSDSVKNVLLTGLLGVGGHTEGVKANKGVIDGKAFTAEVKRLIAADGVAESGLPNVAAAGLSAGVENAAVVVGKPNVAEDGAVLPGQDSNNDVVNIEELMRLARLAASGKDGGDGGEDMPTEIAALPQADKLRIGNELISQALKRIAAILGLPEEDDAPAAFEFDPANVEQLAAIMAYLDLTIKMANDRIDVSANAESANMAMAAYGMESPIAHIEPEENAAELSDFAAALRTEKFRMDMAFRLIGVSGMIAEKMAEKGDAGAATGIPRAINPADLGMSVADTVSAFSNLIREELSASADRVRQIARGQADMTDLERAAVELGTVKSEILKAALNKANSVVSGPVVDGGTDINNADVNTASVNTGINKFNANTDVNAGINTDSVNAGIGIDKTTVTTEANAGIYTADVNTTSVKTGANTNINTNTDNVNPDVDIYAETDVNTASVKTGVDANIDTETASVKTVVDTNIHTETASVKTVVDTNINTETASVKTVADANINTETADAKTGVDTNVNAEAVNVKTGVNTNTDTGTADVKVGVDTKVDKTADTDTATANVKTDVDTDVDVNVDKSAETVNNTNRANRHEQKSANIGVNTNKPVNTDVEADEHIDVNAKTNITANHTNRHERKDVNVNSVNTDNKPVNTDVKAGVNTAVNTTVNTATDTAAADTDVNPEVRAVDKAQKRAVDLPISVHESASGKKRSSVESANRLASKSAESMAGAKQSSSGDSVELPLSVMALARGKKAAKSADGGEAEKTTVEPRTQGQGQAKSQVKNAVADGEAAELPVSVMESSEKKSAVKNGAAGVLSGAKAAAKAAVSAAKEAANLQVESAANKAADEAFVAKLKQTVEAGGLIKNKGGKASGESLTKPAASAKTSVAASSSVSSNSTANSIESNADADLSFENEDAGSGGTGAVDSTNSRSTASARHAEKSDAPALSQEERLEVIRQISEKLNNAVRSGANEIRMVLRPESMGEMRMSIRMQGDVVFARMQVENKQVKAIVESNLQSLKDSLLKQNLEFGAIDVEVGANSDGGKSPRELWQEMADRAEVGGFRETNGVSPNGSPEDSGNFVSVPIGSDTGRRFGDNTFEYFV